MNRRFLPTELFAIRNQISIRAVIENLLRIPTKEIEGVLRFLCPCCHEFQTGVNPKTNLSRCFRCERNFNTIEIVMADQSKTFVESVKFLQEHLSNSMQLS